MRWTINETRMQHGEITTSQLGERTTTQVGERALYFKMLALLTDALIILNPNRNSHAENHNQNEKMLESINK